ncbi:MAG TPA: PHB depolymerase family esterase [Vineibacter sp.]|nr:PHB depolymerase family esterase [Vineibacter sp.]
MSGDDKARIPRGYRLAATAVAVGLLLYCVSIGAALAGEMRTLRLGAVERTYYEHVPAGLKPGAPLVIMLHGAGGSGAFAVQRYRWQAKADAEGFVVVGPDATPAFADRPASFASNPRAWNDGSGRGTPHIRDSDDVGFIAALIDEQARRHGVDRARVYATGFSSGAGMTQRLGQELTGRIAAVAPVAGIMIALVPSLPRPMPVLYVSGDQDPLNPVEGGEIAMPWGGRYPKERLQTLMERWRVLNGCKGLPAITTAASLRIQSWTACRESVEVRYVLIHDHGHEWPGGERSRLPQRQVGPNNAGAYDATQEAWSFLRRWRLN